MERKEYPSLQGLITLVGLAIRAMHSPTSNLRRVPSTSQTDVLHDPDHCRAHADHCQGANAIHTLYRVLLCPRRVHDSILDGIRCSIQD